MARKRGLGTSFLDVLCSAMGGMIVLAVIFSIVKNPTLVPKAGEFLFVVVDGAGGQELGLIVTTPTGFQKSIRPGDRKDLLGEAASEVIARHGRTADGAMRLFVEIREPAVGPWVVEPYFADYAPGTSDAASVAGIRVWTHEGPLEDALGNGNRPSSSARLPTTGAVHREPIAVDIAK